MLAFSAAGDAEVTTGSGDVQVAVPRAQRCRLSTATSSGDAHVDVPPDPSAELGLTVRSDSGNVAVGYR